ncbi:DEAD/DEAH box helicase [Pelagibacterium luteolum]|uniref:ATP-dependent RNA helicase DeaD n=1 Tax=Pelagibacterium luteolum TaxID=440168 RepID=A0A1G7WE75_9HYPH|nr:DEAD/DEAH box helicase [Pelagibacterium luteolum]SDG70281.1 ATP-dependent RNA helicase DeaD [Pelagibacterium luteolum]
MTQSTNDTPAGLPDTVHAALSPALAAQGYTQLTPVQLDMLDDAHADADLLVSAQTGSGKTVAFGIAIASTLLGDAEQFGAAELPLGLVIAPTRELALQVQRELDWLYGKAGIRIATCVGGMDMRTERRTLDRGAHLVVGTPGRLRDHITKGALDLSDMRAVVLDEADEMLDLGFREDLEFILAAAPEERRTLLFSATVPRAIAELAKKFQRDAVRVTATAATEQHADIEYRMTLVRRDEGEHAIINTLLMSESKSALVFCHTREAVRHLTARLANRGFSVVALSGELAQSERSSALQAMRDGRAHVCVATDVAARGIDLPNLDLVIHADLPTNPATLLHRSGRTGRAGRKGVCVLIVPEHRRKAAERVLGFAKLSATVAPAPTIAEIEARYRAQILAAGMDAAEPDETEAEFVAELVAKVPAEKLATAFLRQQMALRPVAEEVSQVDPSMPSKARRKDKGFERSEPREFAERPARGPDMVGGVWFTLSLGRKHRADPKWLLPMICKAGGVTKREVGSIKIDENETRFEIASDAANAFAQQALNQRLEKGVTISRVDGKTAWSPAGQPKHKGKAPYNPEFADAAPSRPKYKPAGAEGAPGKPKFKGAKPDGAPSKPKYKPKTDGGNGKVYKKPKPKK